MDLVPIKVKIGLRPNGHADHPNFNILPSVIAAGIDWAYYVDANGSGWLYDCCGHKEEEPGSPFGMQWAMLLVPAAFAAEAVAALPAICADMTDAEAEAFYDTQHAKYFDQELLDEKVLSAIKTKQELSPPIPLSTRQLKALDPTDDQPGVRTNHNKTFAGFKTRRGIKIVR